MRVDCGEGDPFRYDVEDYVDGFSTSVAGSFEPGGHDVGYWRRVLPEEMEFIGAGFGSVTPS